MANWDTPLWVSPNPTAHRFNHANTGPTQYLALHPLGAWAEYLRGEHRRSTESLAELRGRIWVLRVPVSEVLELTYDNAPGYGASAEDLIAEDQIPCRNLAERWRDDPAAPKVFSAPSAALPGTLNLVVLGPRIAVPYLAEVVDPLLDVPASIVAEGSTAPEGLLPLVRFRGSEHPEFRAWKDRKRFEFRQPSA